MFFLFVLMSFNRMEPRLLKQQYFLILIFIIQYNEAKFFQEVSSFLCFCHSVEWQQVLFCLFGIYQNVDTGFFQAILMSVIWHKKLNLSIEFSNSVLIYTYCCLFVSLLRYWSSFAVAFLAVKIKRYLHFSYMQLFDYLHIHSMTYLTYLNIWKIKI